MSDGRGDGPGGGGTADRDSRRQAAQGIRGRVLAVARRRPVRRRAYEGYQADEDGRP